MGNILNIARKEFSDFTGSQFILIVVVIFLFTFMVNIYFINGYYHHASAIRPYLGYSQYYINSSFTKPALLSALQDSLCQVLLAFGSIIALLMGCLAIANERRNHALATIITKPLFRDTIINGKFIGAMAFLVLFFIFVSAVYTVGMAVVLGDALNPVMSDYLASMPLIIILALLCVMIYYSFSLLVSIFIKNEMMALFVSILIWLIFTQELNSWDISMYIAAFFGQSQLAVMDAIIKLCPNDLIIFPILYYNDNYNVGLINSVMANVSSVITLIIYLFIIVVASYSVFLRRDIS